VLTDEQSLTERLLTRGDGPRGPHGTLIGMPSPRSSVRHRVPVGAAVDIGAPVATDRRSLTAEEQLEEALFTGLRLNAGLDLPGVKERYGVDVWDRYAGELRPFVDQGVLLYDGRSLRLTRAGMLLAHEIMTVFIR